MSFVQVLQIDKQINLVIYLFIMNEEDLNEAVKIFGMQPHLSKKMRLRRQNFLLKQPLFLEIYQKKGSMNFAAIVESVFLCQYTFGEMIYHSSQERFFYYILRGVAMVFTVHTNDASNQPIFKSRVATQEHFGEKILFGNSQKLHEVKSVSNVTYVLQLDLFTFYKTFSGHFQYHQLKNDINFLSKIWAFQHLKVNQLERILLLSPIEIYKRNKIVFREGAEPQHIIVVYSGELTLYKSLPNAKIKYKPFCILTKSAICGSEEFIERKKYQYGAVCTTEETKILRIDPKMFTEFIVDYIPHELFKKRSEVAQLLQSNVQKFTKVRSTSQQIKAINLSMNRFSEKEPNSLRSSVEIQQKQVRKPIQGSLRSTIYEIKPTHSMCLKTESMRDHILSERKKASNHLFKSTRLSIQTNHSLSNEKDLLYKYLSKKEKKLRVSTQYENQYQNKQMPMMKQFSGDKSTAVRNFKRKLRRSRKRYSVEQLSQ